MRSHTIQLMLRERFRDNDGASLERDAKRYFQIRTGKVRTSKVFTVVTDKNEGEIREFAGKALKDPLLHDMYIGDLFNAKNYRRYLYLGKLPGVTDDEGVSAQKTFADFFHQAPADGEQFIFTGELYYFEQALEQEALETLARDMLGNPLINHIEYGTPKRRIAYVPTVKIESSVRIRNLPVDLGDRELNALSGKMLLSLDLKEMQAVRKYYLDKNTQKLRREHGMPPDPTDCELEIFGQTGASTASIRNSTHSSIIKIWRPARKSVSIRFSRPILPVLHRSSASASKKREITGS
ncbi:MAG: hypothetical protein U5N26_08565 [Candidatus Marinimicrobia bacterium]|nr:hypothetical protein [Candidatus Neomarinimicrobiota bacterium]